MRPGGTRTVADRAIAACVGLVVLAFVEAATRLTPTVMNNYTLLADAWLHGRSWINFPGPWIDAVPYHGRAYIVEAPLPAVLMLPVVALYGTHANQSVLAAALAAVSAVAVYYFARDSGNGRIDALILCIFALFGTGLMYGALSSDVWNVAHLSAVTFTLLASLELVGKRRLWLVTLCGLAAALSRYSMVLALPVYWWLLRDQITRARSLAATIAVALPVVALWSAYNWSRWATLYDPGYTIWYRTMDPRSKSNAALLSVTHLSHQLRLFFVERPRLMHGFPWIAPGKFGTALTYVSSGLIVAFGAPRRDRLTVPLALLTILLAIPSLLYYDGGGVQFGVRHALDFEPFLLCLIALSLRERPRLWKRVLLIASAAFGAYLLYVWRAFPYLIV
ncbi:MAG TPA: hypothetical protein VGD01_16135 [Candidatus Elarobacter sp.]